MRLLYPGNPLQRREPDELYAEEYAAAANLGFSVALFSYEDFLVGNLLTQPAIPSGETILYRGWMLTPKEYGGLQSKVEALGAAMMTSSVQYERCHHLPRWYPQLSEFTPETLFFQETEDVATKLRSLGWSACFLKDYVKSLSTGDGAIANDLERIPQVLSKMKAFRGKIEGGICARRVEDFDQDTEERYFVFRGTAYAREGKPPKIVEAAAARIDSPFFSVDTILRRDGVTRIVELGDGQVSDRKKWSAHQLLGALRDERQT